MNSLIIFTFHFTREVKNCTSVWYRDNFDRLTRMDHTVRNNMEGHEEEGRVCLQFQVPNKASVRQGHHMQPSCIILPANAHTHTFVIKPGIRPSFPTFHGMESEWKVNVHTYT